MSPEPATPPGTAFSAWAVIGVKPDGTEDILDIGAPETLGRALNKHFDSPKYDSVHKRDLDKKPLQTTPVTPPPVPPSPTQGSTPEATDQAKEPPTVETVPEESLSVARVCRKVRDSLPRWREWFPNEKSEVEISRQALLLLVAAAEQRDKLEEACRDLMNTGVGPDWPDAANRLWDMALSKAEAALKAPPPL